MTVFTFGENLYPGDMLIPAIIEELEEEQVLDCIDYLRNKFGYEPFPASKMTEIIEQFDIDYHLLPQYLKDKFDEFEVY